MARIAFWSGRVSHLLFILSPIAVAAGPPPDFPASGNGLWFEQPATTAWSRSWLPVGNGYLAVMTPGGTSHESTQLNIESLWSGGPFADPTYNGGNKQPSEQAAMAQAMQNIRNTIFESPTGDIDNVEVLTTDAGQYGSYAGAGYLVSSLNTTGAISGYSRFLDLDNAFTRTSWTQAGSNFQRTTFCSHPTKACTQHTSISTPSSHQNFPGLTITHAYSSALEQDLPAPNITCSSSSTLRVRGRVSPPINANTPGGMLYELIFSASASSGATVRCIQFPVVFGAPPNATLEIIYQPGGSAREAMISWVGGTEFDLNAGDSTHGFSFRGVDPHDSLVTLSANKAVSDVSTYSAAFAEHTADIRNVLGGFALDLKVSSDAWQVPTDVLKAGYTGGSLSVSAKAAAKASGNSVETRASSTSDTYLEWLIFNFGRFLLATSARGALPANLQGKWASGSANAWGADYHSNINIQMNYWGAEPTGLDVTQSLFDYFEKNWVPRGEITARVLYNITRGWVVHNEMNIFGHSGMKGGGNTAEWANYPESAVWMMLHVWDHFDYTNDINWWKAQGWPLIKGVASFHLDKLIPDLHFNDSTLVVNPCNSPEQPPITFGCAHAQQLIWQLFNAVEKGFAASGDTDTAFLEEVRTKRAQMDKGLKVGSFGQLQEWKVEKDSPTDTHRHLSHLIGLFPGYAIASYDSTLQGAKSGALSKEQVLSAAQVSLIHRGNGRGPDADSGWEKAWRAAVWAQLGNAAQFYDELSFTISENLGSNLFSLYNPFDPNPIFQIDANLAYPGALMNALLQAPDVASYSTPLTITLLPALPQQWSSGAIHGARARGGITVDLKWSSGLPTSAVFTVDQSVTARQVNVVYQGKTVASFKTSSGLVKTVTKF